MEQQKKMEQLVLLCIDTAKEMLKEYSVVIPFGIRAFNNTEDMKMNCPGDKIPEDDYSKQINNVVSELREFAANEDVFATAFAIELEADGQSGIGLQVETTQSSVLFVYPYRKKDDDFEIDEPIQTEQLMEQVFNH